MKSFETFLDEKSIQEPLKEQFSPKTWKAKRAEVIDFWRGLKPNLPISIEPVPEHHTGTKFRFDGIRITGRPQFINSILSRIKDMLEHETPGYKLEVEYRQIENKAGNTQTSPEYVFYAHLIQNPVKTAQTTIDKEAEKILGN